MGTPVEFRRRAPLLLCLFVCGCAPAATAPRATPTPSGAPTPALPAAESPARWELHATRASNLRGKLDLGNDGVLYVGEGGERWLDRRDSAGVQAASAIVPEALVAVIRGPGDKGIVLVGASGALFASETPLGPVAAPRRPPVHLRSVVAGKSAVLGISDAGVLMRTTDGGMHWTKVELPPITGTLMQLALSDSGLGLALFAPQHLLVTTDDGATFTPLASPGIGARRIVVDVNGDVMLEGLEASAVLRAGPPRLERVNRPPRSDGFELATTNEGAHLAYARAVAEGRGAFVGTHYLEAIPDGSDDVRWRLAYGPYGSRLEARPVNELKGCDEVRVGGDARTLLLACDSREGRTMFSPMGSAMKAMPRPPSSTPEMRLFRSDDGGKSWVEDGTVGSEGAETGHLWVMADRAIVVDGACKRSKFGCAEGPPLIRIPGSKAFVKVQVPRGIVRFDFLASAPNSGKVFAFARASSGPIQLLVSHNLARNFDRVQLPPPPATDAAAPTFTLSRAEPGSLAIDPSGLVVATAHLGSEWLVYVSDDDGVSWKPRTVPFKADALSLAGRHGLAYGRRGRAWETADAGATWIEVAAPKLADASPGDEELACGQYGCLLSDRATRIGWGAPPAPSDAHNEQESDSRPSFGTPIECALEGGWTSLGNLVATPSAYDTDLAPGVRWLGLRHDRIKGNVAVLVPKVAPKGVEYSEVPLFGPATRDTATAALPQVEGAAALRFAFRREPAKKGTLVGAIAPNQKIDVELAWFMAATGKVHRGVIRGIGPLDPRDVAAGLKDGPGQALVGLLSTAQGGIHVRPFANRPDAPLYFVHEGGKVDRMLWPETPTKDASGAGIGFRVDAVRAGGRTVLLGVTGPGVQVYTAWANETATAWETRTWAIWPEVRGMRSNVAWDFTYVGERAAVVGHWGGGPGLGPTAWAVTLKGPEVDPSEVLWAPTQGTLTDPPRLCDSAAQATPRVVAPRPTSGQHPVMVDIDGKSTTLTTGAAVLRGSANAGCVRAYDAHASSGGGGNHSAIISTDDMAHAWLFREAAGSSDVSVRPMACRFSKSENSGRPANASTPSKDGPLGRGRDSE